jgi:hypothetical protein
VVKPFAAHHSAANRLSFVSAYGNYEYFFLNGLARNYLRVTAQLAHHHDVGVSINKLQSGVLDRMGSPLIRSVLRMSGARCSFC